jgi:serine O-acetyltransferase
MVMQDAYKQYMHKVFDREFIDYPGELLDASYDYFMAIEEILLSDLCVTHVGYVAPFDAGLFQWLLLNPAAEAVFYYRLSRVIFLTDDNHPLLPFLSALMRRRTGIEVYYSTNIGPGFSIVHGSGIVIGPRYNIGKNFLVYQGVTIGQSKTKNPDQTVTIGDDVIVYTGAKILGDITIGDNVHIGANAVVVDDLQSNALYAGVPARLVRDL